MNIDEKLKQALKWIDGDDVVIIESIFEELKQQSQDRERVLREALELIKKDLQEYCDGVLVYSTAFEIAMPIIDKALEASK